jgi:hypothetical protein
MSMNVKERSSEHVVDIEARTEGASGAQAGDIYGTLDGDLSADHTTLTDVVLRTNGGSAGQLVGVSECGSRGVGTTCGHHGIGSAQWAVEQQHGVFGEHRSQSAIIGETTTFSHTDTALKTEVACEHVHVDRVGGGKLNAIQNRGVGQQAVEHSGADYGAIGTNTDLIGYGTLPVENVGDRVVTSRTPVSTTGGDADHGCVGVVGGPVCVTESQGTTGDDVTGLRSYPWCSPR